MGHNKTFAYEPDVDNNGKPEENRLFSRPDFSCLFDADNIRTYEFVCRINLRQACSR